MREYATERRFLGATSDDVVRLAGRRSGTGRGSHTDRRTRLRRRSRDVRPSPRRTPRSA
ncbi:hypothetical protein HX744_17070 [Pseudonocardia sp. ICBG1122]|nr:hypothetical protein [Pseudonocardia pini]